MRILYNLGIHLYSLFALIASPFSTRAKLWVEGRRNWKENIGKNIGADDKVVWVHCASLGEFEQGRPIIEEIKQRKPGIKIVLSFFSPSGYEIRKNYQFADCVTYLPADTKRNTSDFVDLVHPVAAIFIKYEFWENYITAIYKRNIPLYLVSGIFRPDQHFFKWYGSFFREMLRKFTFIFVQDSGSETLLNSIGINAVLKTGDTRFDRVVQIAKASRDIEKLDSFAGTEKVFLTGSSWSPDEEIISRYINDHPHRMKWIFAPHEIDNANIERLEKMFKTKVVRFSQYEGTSDARVMIIDNIGMLSSAYSYAKIAAVGGGFGKGIHNVLEPACWGIPVLFGPRHEKFREATELIKEKGAFTFNSFEIFSFILDKLLDDETFYLESANAASQYINNNIGATEKIMSKLLCEL
ncbi:MAG TPA: glycosyltransferase N-terminal domain-containing protein [Bacteroidales bacterium]|nr:glycosyltransferase N-terminal domain-containing protein [Bacteroidales bacterium]